MPALTAIAKTIVFLALVLVVPFYLWHQGGFVPSALLTASGDGEAHVALEDSLRDALPMSRELGQLGMELRFLGGERERNGVFLGDDALVRNIAPANGAAVEENSEALEEFAGILLEVSSRRRETYLAVIPTSGAIQTEKLPRFAASLMVNQRRVIENIYSEVSPSVRTMDVFSSLDDHDDEYLYYRTEDNLTALGGYYAYYAIARRLSFLGRELSRYEVQYAAYGYYGGLYPATRRRTPAGNAPTLPPYRGMEPDSLALYRYTGAPREYTVTHINGGERRTYHTLYPESAMLLGAPMDVYLGGRSPRIEIVTSSSASSQNENRLLVFGDKTAAAYLPFLLNNYREVTLCDLSLMTDSEIRTLRPDNYGEVLFAYSIESYIHSSDHIARIAEIDWDGIYAAVEGR
jgi:hypothetical protein